MSNKILEDFDTREYQCFGCGQKSKAKIVHQVRKFAHVPDGWVEISITDMRIEHFVLCRLCMNQVDDLLAKLRYVNAAE